MHTLGLWRIEKASGTKIYDENGTTLADCMSTQRALEENKANACLVATAPELLDALKTLIQDEKLQVATWRLEKALKAISKAEYLDNLNH